MSIQKKNWRKHKECSKICKLTKSIMNSIEKISSDANHQIDTNRSSIMDISQQIDAENQNPLDHEEKPVDS